MVNLAGERAEVKGARDRPGEDAACALLATRALAEAAALSEAVSRRASRLFVLHFLSRTFV